MGVCINCKKRSPVISETLGVCLKCIRRDFRKVSNHITSVHEKTRAEFGLPEKAPKHKNGISCNLCVNECRIPEGKTGYCGLRKNISGKLKGPTEDKANVGYYYDNLPTNCVADWVCPGGTGAGYPRFAHKPGPEIGFKNLAVFYTGCSFNCLFCQNWHYRLELRKAASVTADDLSNAVDDRTSCICYFGGDPSPQLPHSIKTSRKALLKKSGKILRICWETNGTMNPGLLKEILDLALISGGCIKFDLKTYDENLNIALSGITNKRTLENFKLASKYIGKRESPPLLVASTLLIPGYVDREEVYAIAKFISGLNPSIPYSLLGFAPHFYMPDLPYTSRRHAEECLEAAKNAGLGNVRIGNIHLLGTS